MAPLRKYLSDVFPRRVDRVHVAANMVVTVAVAMATLWAIGSAAATVHAQQFDRLRSDHDAIVEASVKLTNFTGELSEVKTQIVSLRDGQKKIDDDIHKLQVEVSSAKFGAYVLFSAFGAVMTGVSVFGVTLHFRK